VSRAVVSLRLSIPELKFIDQIAAEKNVTRAAALHQMFLQQVVLQEIEKSVIRVIDSHLAELRDGLISVRQELSKKATREDLAAATNYLADRIKK